MLSGSWSPESHKSDLKEISRLVAVDVTLADFQSSSKEWLVMIITDGMSTAPYLKMPSLFHSWSWQKMDHIV